MNKGAQPPRSGSIIKNKLKNKDGEDENIKDAVIDLKRGTTVDKAQNPDQSESDLNWIIQDYDVAIPGNNQGEVKNQSYYSSNVGSLNQSGAKSIQSDGEGSRGSGSGRNTKNKK